MKTSTTPAPATLSLCARCKGHGTVGSRAWRCGDCGGKGIALDIRADVLSGGYAIASRAEHIAILAAALKLAPALRDLPTAAASVSYEVDAVLAQAADDVVDRAVAAFARAGLMRMPRAAE
jgi:hypothetical protein